MNNLNNMQNSSSYEQKKNNGKGIFYGVIAVATLIVAIIGATFAYFTASANSSQDALSAVAAHVEVNYVEGKQLKATNLIPASATVVTKAYKQDSAWDANTKAGCTYKGNGAEAAPESSTSATNWDCAAATTSGYTAKSTGDVGTKCVDDNGYYVCAVYQFSVINTSNVKQALQAYLSINSNTFVTKDKTVTVADGTKEADTTGPLALKFMTVRSDSVIDTTVISSADKSATNCSADTLTGMNATNPSTRFCTSTGTDDADKDVFTDTSGSYYYFNTTAVRQSMNTEGTQTVFSGEVVPSIAVKDLTASNGILYMHTASDTANQVTEVGPTDTKVTLTEVWADKAGNSYTSQALCTTGINGKYNEECKRVYLSTNSATNGTDDVVLGAYGQVKRTYYIVAWLEETDRGQDEDQDKSFAATINVTSGSIGANGITGTMNK